MKSSYLLANAISFIFGSKLRRILQKESTYRYANYVRFAITYVKHEKNIFHSLKRILFRCVVYTSRVKFVSRGGGGGGWVWGGFGAATPLFRRHYMCCVGTNLFISRVFFFDPSSCCFVLPAIYLISGYPAVYATEGYDLVTYRKSKFHDFLPLLASTEKLSTRRAGFELAPSLGTCTGLTLYQLSVELSSHREWCAH